MSHAFAENQRGELRLSEISPQLTTGGGKPGQGYPAVLTSSTAASRASHSPWPADAVVLRTNVTDGLSSDGSCANCGHDGSLQRMSPDFYPRVAAEPVDGHRFISDAMRDADATRIRASYASSGAEFRKLMRDVTSPEFCPTFDNSGSLVSPTRFWTRATSESRNAADACSLSRVLEDAPSSKYSLSAKAAAGILRRAERRGKELPGPLLSALHRLAATDGE